MPPRNTSSTKSTAPVHYHVHVAESHRHLLHIALHIERPAAQQVVSLPVWIPGSYLVREFARNLQQLHAIQSARNVAVQQQDKQSWTLACTAHKPLTLQYSIFALDDSVRAAWFDSLRCFFNSSSLLLRVHGQEHLAHTMTLQKGACIAPDWRVATALTPGQTDTQGWGAYGAGGYDELVDCPVEIGDFWSGSFEARGVPHRLVVTGAANSFDGQRLLADSQKICETAIRLWHPRGKPHHKNYLFLLHAVDAGYGGLEHRNCAALICKRGDLPQPTTPSRSHDGYTALLGLISHEYFHAWNVKRLRPVEFTRYDYTQENYTRLLWFFEGFTSYYDDLLLRRAGLIDDAAYLQLLGKNINHVAQTPGRKIQSVAQASFEAWTKYYRPDANTANATVSYYTKGALVAASLDLSLRLEGKTTLDTVMRALWQRCKAGPMCEQDLLAVLHALTGRSWARKIAAWVHGTDELPVLSLLQKFGITVRQTPLPLLRQWGLQAHPTPGGLRICAVASHSAAEQAGMAAGDEWLGIETGPAPTGRTLKNKTAAHANTAQAWRISTPEDVALYTAGHTECVALISRDKHLLRLPLSLPAQPQVGALSPTRRATPLRQKHASNVQLGIEGKLPAHTARWLRGTA